MSDLTDRPATKVYKTDEEWRKTLTPEQYRVTRKHGTERAGTGPHLQETREGVFHCVGCGAPLVRTAAKYEAGTGWPSFFEPISPDAVTEHEDRGLFMRRTEIRCATCDAHLGHVFPDGPRPTGQRYCMNGVALDFEPQPDG
jgi:peptide-methionine (R)-S-oxide reductase